MTLSLSAPVDSKNSENTLNDQDLQTSEAQHTSLYGYNSDRYPNYPHVFGGYPFDYGMYIFLLLL